MDKKTLYADRMKRVLDAMAVAKLDGLVVSDPQSIWYLTGIYNEPYERLFALYLSQDGEHRFFLNKLYNIHDSGFTEVWTSDTDDIMGTMARNVASKGRIGIDKVWPARFLIPLMEHNPEATYVLGSSCVDDARACKDAEEQRLMKEASRVNDVCIQRGAAFVKPGVTEKQVAEYIDAQFKAEGAEKPSFTTIVSFGKNAADPHHEPDDTVVQESDCVLIDMGCQKNRYCSDMTRTFFFKKAPEEYTKIHDLVRMANEKAESIIKPGVRFCDIDAAARDLIAQAGYGEQFNHRLGHFIGQSDHEQGDVSSANTNVAKEGMIFSIEPGIYLQGKFGVRVEDLVLVTKDGCEVLNSVDKHWKVIG
ncbi:MAG: Xaa-Pro peptidase family protein [Treponema sp.]|nr:Xaa-Pro peptidase family protein [Treponema sp.]